MIPLQERTQSPDPEIQFGELHPELYPGLEVINEAMIEKTSLVAMVAKVQIFEKFTLVPVGEKLTGEEKDRRVKIFDETGANISRRHGFTTGFRDNSVGAEGKKEGQDYKGGIEIDTVRGIQGNGEYIIWTVQDIIEGTTATANNKPGGISIIAATTAGGVIPTPEIQNVSGKEVSYMEKLMGPATLAGKISLDKKPEQNLQEAAKLVANPSDIEITILNRPRNEALIQLVRDFGAVVNLIEAGDLVPALDAMRDKRDGKIRMVMGIGGWEEGVIAAVAAKALGAVAEGKMAEVWKEDGVENHEVYPDLLSIDNLVPATKDQCSVIFTAITDVNAFELNGVDLEKGEAQGITIDHNGVHKNIIPFDPANARRAREEMEIDGSEAA